MRRFIQKYFMQLLAITIMAIVVIVMLQQSFNVISKIQQKSVELKQVKMDQVLTGEYVQNVHEFKKNAQYISENEQYLNVLLPNNDDEKVKLFSMLEQLARDTGNVNVVLAVRSAAAKDVEKTDDKEAAKPKIVPNAKEYLAITISLTGEYNDLIAFLRKMENMQYFSDVLSIKLVKAPADTITNQRSKNLDDELDEEIEDEIKKVDLLKAEVSAVFYLEGKK